MADPEAAVEPPRTVSHSSYSASPIHLFAHVWLKRVSKLTLNSVSREISITAFVFLSVNNRESRGKSVGTGLKIKAKLIGSQSCALLVNFAILDSARLRPVWADSARICEECQRKNCLLQYFSPNLLGWRALASHSKGFLTTTFFCCITFLQFAAK